MGGNFAPGFSEVLQLTLRDVEEQLGATEAELRTMDMEEVLKQLYTGNGLETLPSFMRAPSWQQPGQPATDAMPSTLGTSPPPGTVVVAAVNPAAWEATAAAGAAAQDEQQAAAAAVAQHGEVPLSSVRMDQIFSWYAESQAQTQQPQVVPETMTLSQLFDQAGLQLAAPGMVPASQQGPVVMLPQPPTALHAQLGLGHGSMAPSTVPGSLHMHAASSMLPAGLTPGGPFASSSLPIVEASLMSHSMQPTPSMQPTGRPPKGDTAAAARAARTRKRKAGEGGGGGAGGSKAGGLSASEAAKQALEVAERAAAELAELPQDLGDKEGRAIKRAIKNRESAARSRAKRQEYTATLEQQVEQLKNQNNNLRHQVIRTAAAPPDPHAATLEGELLRRSRTGPI